MVFSFFRQQNYCPPRPSATQIDQSPDFLDYCHILTIAPFICFPDYRPILITIPFSPLCFSTLLRHPVSSSCFATLFRHPVFVTLFRHPVSPPYFCHPVLPPASPSYFAILFRHPVSPPCFCHPVSPSCFAILFRHPIFTTCFAILFRHPIFTTCFAIQFSSQFLPSNFDTGLFWTQSAFFGRWPVLTFVSLWPLARTHNPQRHRIAEFAAVAEKGNDGNGVRKAYRMGAEG